MAPLWIAVHGTILPDRRSTLLEVDWNQSPHVHCVDIDWIEASTLEPTADRPRPKTFGLAAIGIGTEPRDGAIVGLPPPPAANSARDSRSESISA